METLQVQLEYHESTKTMHRRRKHPAEGVGMSTDQQSVACYVTRQSELDDIRPAEQTLALITKMIANGILPVTFVKDGFSNFNGFY